MSENKKCRRKGKGNGKKKEDREHMYKRPDTGIWIWRRTCPRTKKRITKSTKTRNKSVAQRKVREFEEEFEKRKVGLKSYECWSTKLLPLVPAWLESLQNRVQQSTLKQKKRQVERALNEFHLITAADLDNLPNLDRRLLSLGLNGRTLRRCYQNPLKQFSRWLSGNKRHLDRDPLLSWEPVLCTVEPSVKRRAFLPEEVARALLAADCLAKINRGVSQRINYLVLLTTAPRSGALRSRDVKHFLVEDSRIDFGTSSGNKRVGAGALDKKTGFELREALGSRTSGPLLVTPRGCRLRKERFLDGWREAFGFGLVDALWPEDVPKERGLVYLVNRALRMGEVKVSRGGNPKLLSKETRRKLLDLKQRVESIVKSIGEKWRSKMVGIDIHSFRKTHRTWAAYKKIDGIIVDKQLGHSGVRHDEDDFVKLMQGSPTGHKYYLDRESSLFDPILSANAIRELLDDAMGKVLKDQNSILKRDTATK